MRQVAEALELVGSGHSSDALIVTTDHAKAVHQDHKTMIISFEEETPTWRQTTFLVRRLTVDTNYMGVLEYWPGCTGGARIRADGGAGSSGLSARNLSAAHEDFRHAADGEPIAPQDWGSGRRSIFA